MNKKIEQIESLLIINNQMNEAQNTKLVEIGEGQGKLLGGQNNIQHNQEVIRSDIKQGFSDLKETFLSEALRKRIVHFNHLMHYTDLSEL